MKQFFKSQLLITSDAKPAHLPPNDL